MSTHAFIAYLRVEANHEEERARGLRALADGIASGATEEGKQKMRQHRGYILHATMRFVSFRCMNSSTHHIERSPV
jgi:hypothetical protein